jgi:RHS repeat-associated protein
MGALKLSYYENNIAVNGSNDAILKVVAKDGVIIRQSSNYYTFGSPMNGRSFASSSYRFGFNGKENDNEVKGNGNQQDYGMRIYDTRLGRFLSVDPLSHSYPWFTPYQFAGNTPISAIDLDGLENVYITTNSNGGECMEVVYTADDIAKIIAGQRPEFKVHYTNTGKETGQFEGPNKSNENKVFQGIKPLIETSGVTQYLEDVPNDNKGRDFVKIINNYDVPAPRPRIHKKPGPPKDILPSLSINFKGGSDEFTEPSQVDAIVKPVAEYLLKNPKATINLFGNTGVEGDPNAPTGNGPDVMNSPPGIGTFKTTGELMKARAEAVKTFLTTKYKIDSKRISTSPGTQTQGAAGRNVSVEGTK